MPSFDKLKFTANGLALQANAQAGSQLTFSKIKLGKGTLSRNVNDLADLVNPAIEANIITGTLNENVYTVQANATNDGLAEGFYWTELGLFAQDNEGNEVLYAYASTTEETDYIPSESESSYMKRVKIALAVGNATNITIVKSDGTYVDVLTFNEKLEEIKTSLANIDKQISGCVTTEELDEVKTAIEKQISKTNEDLTALGTALNKDITSIKNNYATTASLGDLSRALVSHVAEASQGLSNHIQEANQKLSELEGTVEKQNTAYTNNVSSINKTIGSTSISGIGDGTIKGAIAKLFEMVNAIPAITKGTANPSGGQDGDVYIQHD